METPDTEPGRDPSSSSYTADASESDALFRAPAIRYAFHSDPYGGVVRISPPWISSLFFVVASFLAAGLVTAFLGRFEVNGRGRGILRPAGGIRILVAEAPGVVRETFGSSGSFVQSGAPVVELGSVQTEMSVLEAETQLSAMKAAFEELTRTENLYFQKEKSALSARLQILQEQTRSLENSLESAGRRVRASAALEQAGLTSALSADEARETLAQLQRQAASSRQAVLQTEQELAALEVQHHSRLSSREHELRVAQTRREVLALPLRQGFVRAPVAGYLESVRVRPGDVVQAGQQVAKLIPKEASLEVVAFLAENDRGFVKVGDLEHLEFDRFPRAEFGTLPARIVRVGEALVSMDEIRDVLGDSARLETPSYRVELRALRSEGKGARAIPLEPGMLLNVRFRLRTRRPITLVFEPLRRWLD